MKAVLLAAGRGSRLGEYTAQTPKCMLTVGSRRIIDYQIQCLEALHIRTIIVVVGFMAKSVMRYLTETYPRISFSFIENPDYVTTNTAYSLWLAKEEFIDSDFVYFNADVIFHAEILRRLLYSPDKNILAVNRADTGDEEVKVELHGSRVLAIGKDVPKEKAYGEFIGIGKFSREISPLFAAQLLKVITEPRGKMQFFEAALQRMLSSVKFTALDITDLPAIEIDFPEDLRRAERNIIHRIARTKKGPKKPKILFYAERNLHLPFLEPVHDYIAEHFEADLAFSSPPHRLSQGGLAGCGLPQDDIQRLKAKTRFLDNPSKFHADIAVVADTCFYPVRHCKKIVNLGHGLISKGWFYTEDPVVRRENRADLICVPGPWHKEILERNVFSRIVVTGFIKTDGLLRCTDYEKKKFKEKYKIDEETDVILFAPTFNEELSALPCIQDRITEIADEKTRVLVKLHGMTDKAWVEKYRCLAQGSEHISLIDNSEIAAAMLCSHVMVSDVSSMAAEFMLLDKPVIFFNNPRQKEYCQYRPLDIEYVIRDAGIQVGSMEELKLALRLALAQPDIYREKRRMYASKLSLPIDGNATARAAEAIIGLFDSEIESSEIFSIILQHDKSGSDTLATCLNDISENNQGIRTEVILLTPHTAVPERANVRGVIKCSEMNRKAFLKAAAGARGDFVVFINSGMKLPRNWLRWMSNYFRWFRDAGAVRALSYKDDYQSILQQVPTPQRPSTLSDTADYFLCSLMGNSVRATGFDLKRDCVMMTRKALESIVNDPSFHIDNTSSDNTARALSRKGFSIWNAVEVFWYPAEYQVINEGEHGSIDRSIEHLPDSNDKLIDTHEAEQIEEMIQRAGDLKKRKDYGKAISCLEQAKELFETLTGRHSACGEEVLEHSKHTAAFAEHNNENGSYEKARSLYDEARQHKKEKEYRKAIEALERAKNCLGENAQGGIPMYSRSIEDLQFDIYQQLGECYTHTGDIDKAREHFDTARRLKPESELPLIGMAVAVMQQQNFSEAEHLFRKALSLNPHSDKALAGLGLVFQNSGRISESLDAFQGAIESNPTNLTALLGVVQAAYSVDRLDTAIHCMNRYLEHYPANTKILYCLAGTYFKQGDFESCREALERLFIFDPEHPEARELLNMLEQAQGSQYAQCRTA